MSLSGYLVAILLLALLFWLTWRLLVRIFKRLSQSGWPKPGVPKVLAWIVAAAVVISALLGIYLPISRRAQEVVGKLDTKKPAPQIEVLRCAGDNEYVFPPYATGYVYELPILGPCASQWIRMPLSNRLRRRPRFVAFDADRDVFYQVQRGKGVVSKDWIKEGPGIAGEGALPQDMTAVRFSKSKAPTRVTFVFGW